MKTINLIGVYSLPFVTNVLCLCTTFTIGSIVTATTATAADNQHCGVHSKESPIRSTLASASTWKNLRGSAGSISYESNAIFHTAKDDLQTLEKPTGFCPKGCSEPAHGEMVFRSTPHKVLTQYDDASRCKDLEQATAKTPLTYSTEQIHDIDGLNRWISDLSQGKGDAGENLYKRCDASCSPRYEYIITRVEGVANRFQVHASVTCGAARDKDDDQYDLDAFFRWRCTS